MRQHIWIGACALFVGVLHASTASAQWAEDSSSDGYCCSGDFVDLSVEPEIGIAIGMGAVGLSALVPVIGQLASRGANGGAARPGWARVGLILGALDVLAGSGLTLMALAQDDPSEALIVTGLGVTSLAALSLTLALTNPTPDTKLAMAPAEDGGVLVFSGRM